MNRVYITLMFLFAAFNSHAQKQLLQQSIGLQYNDDHIGRNINVTFRQAIEKWALYGGVKYHINSRVHDNAGHTYMKRFYAEEFHQHFGLKFGAERTFSLKTGSSELFAFYDFQYTRAITRSTYYYPVGHDSTVGYLYGEHLSMFGPVHALENTLGLGARFKLKSRLFFSAFVGGSVIYITHRSYDEKHKTYFVGGNQNWEFSRMFGIGLEYNLR